jgi:hypothetical protein
VPQQPRSKPFPPAIGTNHHIFQPANGAAFGRTDREQQANHADDVISFMSDENDAYVGGLNDKSQSSRLLLRVGMEISLLREQQVEQFDELGNIA